MQPCAGTGSNQPTAIRLRRQLLDLLAAMPVRRKRRYLLLQALHQFVASAKHQARNVVQRFVAIQLGALTAGVWQGIDQVGAQALQAQLKHLKQPHRPGANHHHIGIDGGVDGGVSSRGRGSHGVSCAVNAASL